VVQVEYVQDWLTTKLEDTGQKQAAWRVDPARAGEGGCLGDIGTHAHNLAGFVSGLTVRELAADLSRFVPGRRLDDNVHMLLRFENGARGMLWGSQVAPGNENGLRLRVYGDKGGLEWSQEHPNQLRFAPVGQPPRILSRGGPNLGPAASRATRIPSGHPEGYLEAFANLYRDLAEQIRARRANRAPMSSENFSRSILPPETTATIGPDPALPVSAAARASAPAPSAMTRAFSAMSRMARFVSSRLTTIEPSTTGCMRCHIRGNTLL